MYTRNTRYPELFKPGSGAVWWAFIPRQNGKGKKLRESTKHTDAVAAHEWYLARIRARPDSAVETPGVTLVQALDARLKWIRSARKTNDPTRKRLAPDTIDFYEKKSKPLLGILGPETPLANIGHAQIRHYIQKRSETVKATTIGKELTALSMAWALCRKEVKGLPLFLDIVPADFQARYVPKTRWLPEDEVERVIKDLEPHRAAIFAFLVSTGATYPSEVQGFRKKHVLEKYLIHINGTKADARDRDVVIPEYAQEWFDFAMRNLPTSGFQPWASVRRDFHRCAKRLEIAPWSPNDCRRTFAQFLVRSGVPYELAAPMMGHNSTKMLQQVYGKRDARAIAKLVAVALKNAPKNARRAG